MNNIIPMRCRIFLTLLFAVIAFSGVGRAVLALDRFPSPEEQRLLSLINEARRAPLDMASRLGMDRAKVLADLPEMQGVLQNGLPPLAMNQVLEEAAARHTRDMLERGYYSSFSPEGSTALDRVAAAGYMPAKAGESLGLITFRNFISPDDAVWFIFSNLFADELKPKGKGRHILDPAMEEIGIAVGSGRWLTGGTVANAYVTTCDFGASRVSAGARAVLQLINQARAHPLQAAVSLGLDPASLLDALPDLRDVLENGIPPVRWNLALYEAAEGHGWDMLTRGYFDHFSPEGLGWEDRMIAAGYYPFESGESMRILVSVDRQDPMETAREHFERILLRELGPDCVDRTILNPALREVGIGFIEAGPEDLPESAGEFSGFNNYLLVMDFGSRDQDAETYITGRIYWDADENGLYSPEEAIGGARVLVRGNGLERYLLANIAGGFFIPLPPGSYELWATDERGHSAEIPLDLPEFGRIDQEIRLYGEGDR